MAIRLMQDGDARVFVLVRFKCIQVSGLASAAVEGWCSFSIG